MNQIEDFVPSLNAYYTTNTLTYFARGGRLSKVEAFIGNAIKINPIMDCDPNGKLRVIEKVRRSRKALDRLIEKIKNIVIPTFCAITFTHKSLMINRIIFFLTKFNLWMSLRTCLIAFCISRTPTLT